MLRRSPVPTPAAVCVRLVTNITPLCPAPPYAAVRVGGARVIISRRGARDARQAAGAGGALHCQGAPQPLLSPRVGAGACAGRHAGGAAAAGNYY